MIMQIDGLSGTGKTTVAQELRRRGYNAIDSDAVFAYYGDPETGEPTDVQSRDNWIWDLSKVRSFAKKSADDVVFVCGGALNQEKISEIFDKRFTLVVDSQTLKHRLLTRTNNDYGKHPDELAEQLELNATFADYARSIGSIVVDATRPVGAVVDEILAKAH
jgi:uridine kinase